MQPSRSLAIATGVTLAVAGAVSALFLTVGAGASSLDSTGDGSGPGDSTTVATDAATDDHSSVEFYTLDDNGQLVPMDGRSNPDSSGTVAGRDDYQYENEQYENEEYDDEEYYEDDHGDHGDEHEYEDDHDDDHGRHGEDD